MNKESTILAFDASRCTGCAACAEACPRNAIEFEPTSEGFLYPAIDQGLCISCGKCQKVCAANPDFATAGNEIFEGYVALSSTYSMTSRSSSGGIADALTRYVLSSGEWVVAGCVMEEDGSVCHRLISEEDDAWRLQGSKYVQSEVSSGVMHDCRSALEDGKRLLFFGTPCQVHGIRAALSAHEDRIVGVDLICHGVPSPLFWKRAFAELANDGFVKNGKDLLFRHRSTWERNDFSFLNYNHHSKRKHELNAYYSTFLAGSSFRESCYTCKFASPFRAGDITIGDCATLSNYLEFAPVESASSILVNTDKGRVFLHEVLKLKVIKVIPLDYRAEARANAQLNRPSHRPALRDSVYRDLCELPYEQFERRYRAGISVKREIKNIAKRFIPISLRTKIRLLMKKGSGRNGTA